MWYVFVRYNIYLLFHLRCDYLKITDEKNRTFEEYCGMKTGRYVYVTGRTAVLTFHSDYSFQRRGFFILFTIVAIGKYIIWNAIFFSVCVKESNYQNSSIPSLRLYFNLN